MRKFPKNFYWGAATASYQVEGWNENTDWAKAAKEGRVPPAGRLADHYHRYEEDFAIAQKLGHNAHRFSIEWARIEPEEGKWDFAEVEHYRQVIQALRKRNIEPFITLWHFTLPQWFADRGGFERADAPQIFARYCAFVVKQLGDECCHFATINEPNVWAGHGWLYGAWPPFKRAKIGTRALGKDDGSTRRVGAIPRTKHLFTYFRVERHLVQAHVQAYEAIKAVRTDVQVGIIKHIRWFTANDTWLNKLKARVMQYLQSGRYLKRINHALDEIGLNYYRHTVFGDTKNYLQTDMDWDIYPSGIYGALQTLRQYRKPIFISEAGIADADDDIRWHYLYVQLLHTQRAIADGVDVRGYMYWSLLDNYEWALGTAKCFGLVAVNYKTLERTIRPSAWEYKKIIEQNGITDTT